MAPPETLKGGRRGRPPWPASPPLTPDEVYGSLSEQAREYPKFLESIVHPDKAFNKPEALDRIRVLDCSTGMIIGHWASSMLAELGAEVIQVEPPGGDPLRRLTPFGRKEYMVKDAQRGEPVGLHFLHEMRNKLAITLLLSFGSLAACTTDEGGGGSADIADSQLAGTVGGQTWQFAAGHTSALLSEGEPDFFASLYPMTFTACGFSEPSGNHLIVSIPKTPGEYEMGLSRNMTFVVCESDNLVAFNGKIVVDEVTATSVKGGLVGSYDSSNEVSGRFEVTICPE